MRQIITKIISISSVTFLLCSFKTNDSLKDSEPLGPYYQIYDSYNCYAYALERREMPKNYVRDWLKPGHFTGLEAISTNNLEHLRMKTEDDLKALGYINIYSSKTLSESSHDFVMTLRVGADDFHFMKMMDKGLWYHKPSHSLPLKYNYSLLDTQDWTDEGIFELEVINKTKTYTGDIYYIHYDNPYFSHSHSYIDSYEWMDKKTHYAYCSCGYKLKIGHIVIGSPNAFNEYTCIECNGIAEMGFINNYRNSLDYDYTYLMDGILHLSNEDYNLYINNNYELPNEYLNFEE